MTLLESPQGVLSAEDLKPAESMAQRTESSKLVEHPRRAEATVSITSARKTSLNRGRAASLQTRTRAKRMR